MSKITEQPEFAVHETRRLCSYNTLTDSIKILFDNPKLFISISLLTVFPFTLLVFYFALYCRPLKSQIHHLEAVALITPRFEAGQILKQVRVNSVTLLWLKALFWLPCYGLSLLAMITAVNSTALACAGTRPSLVTAVAAAKLTWRRPLVTSICVFVIMVAYVQLTSVVTARVGWLMVVFGAVLEVELMAVLSFAMVVSVVEERFGWEAVKVAWGLMAGRRFCGWVLSGFLVLVSGGIGWGFRVSMDSRDETMGLVVEAGLICLFGLIVLWSYMVYTVFYCGCSRTTRRVNTINRSDNGCSKV